MNKIIISISTFSLLAIILFLSRPKEKELKFPIKEVFHIGVIGQIVTYRGEAHSLSGGKSKVLKLKDPVSERDTIQTKEKSFVKIRMLDGSSISIGPNSTLKLQEYKVHAPSQKDISLNLVKGIIRTHFVGKNKKGSIQVITRSAVMGVRGTDFITEVNDESLKVSLLEGKVDVISSGGKSLTALLPGQKIIFNDLTQPDIFILSTLLETEAEINDMVEIKNEQPLLESSVSLPGQMSPLSPILNNLSGKTTIPSKKASSEKSQPSRVAKKVENFRAHRKILMSENFESLPREEKIELIEIAKQVNEERAEALESSDNALPLITPDKKVVFFEDKPELKALLPRDENGEILGLRVDKDYEPVGDMPSGLEEGVNLSLIEVPVVNAQGQIEKISVQNSQSRVSEVPVKADGSSAGLPQAVVEQAARGVASLELEVEDGKKNNGNKYGQEKNDSFSDDSENVNVNEKYNKGKNDGQGRGKSNSGKGDADD